MGLQFTPVQRPDSLRDVWFKGGLSSRIRLEERWTITDDVFNSTAVTNAPKDSFALGKWEWTVTGDHVNCHKGELNIKTKPHYVLVSRRAIHNLPQIHRLPRGPIHL